MSYIVSVDCSSGKILRSVLLYPAGPAYINGLLCIKMPP